MKIQPKFSSSGQRNRANGYIDIRHAPKPDVFGKQSRRAVEFAWKAYCVQLLQLCQGEVAYLCGCHMDAASDCSYVDWICQNLHKKFRQHHALIAACTDMNSEGFSGLMSTVQYH